MAGAVAAVTADTADVRVTTWTFGVDAGTGQHRHEFDYVVVPVTGGVFTVTDLQGRASPMEQVAGFPYLGTAGTAHDVSNATGRQVSFVEVEVRRPLVSVEKHPGPSGPPVIPVPAVPAGPPSPPTAPEPSSSSRDRVLLLTSQIEVFALQLESMALRHTQVAPECAELSRRMRAAVREHRTTVRPGTAGSTAGAASAGSDAGLPSAATGIEPDVPTTKEIDMASGVAAVWVPVEDMDRAVGFYRDVLGLQVRSQSPDWSEIEAGGLMIGLNGREETSAHAEGGAVISFQPDGSIDDEVEELRAKGVNFTGGISDHEWGRIIPFKDTEGNDLQFYAPPQG